MRATHGQRLASRTPSKRWNMHIPAQSQEHVRLNDVLLQLHPSLPGLRRKLPSLVRSVHRYYGAVRLLQHVHVRRTAVCLHGPAFADCHRESVRVAIDELEKYVQARMGGNRPAETTGKWVAASFEHDSARPVGGTPRLNCILTLGSSTSQRPKKVKVAHCSRANCMRSCLARS